MSGPIKSTKNEMREEQNFGHALEFCGNKIKRIGKKKMFRCIFWVEKVGVVSPLQKIVLLRLGWTIYAMKVTSLPRQFLLFTIAGENFGCGLNCVHKASRFHFFAGYNWRPCWTLEIPALKILLSMSKCNILVKI